jgi:hypothetical protein
MRGIVLGIILGATLTRILTGVFTPAPVDTPAIVVVDLANSLVNVVPPTRLDVRLDALTPESRVRWCDDHGGRLDIRDFPVCEDVDYSG